MNDDLVQYTDKVRETFLEDYDVQGALEDFIAAMVTVNQIAYGDISKKNQHIELLKRELADRLEHLAIMTEVRVERDMEEGDAECALTPYKEERERRMRA